MSTTSTPGGAYPGSSATSSSHTTPRPTFLPATTFSRGTRASSFPDHEQGELTRSPARENASSSFFASTTPKSEGLDRESVKNRLVLVAGNHQFPVVRKKHSSPKNAGTVVFVFSFNARATARLMRLNLLTSVSKVARKILRKSPLSSREEKKDNFKFRVLYNLKLL